MMPDIKDDSTGPEPNNDWAMKVAHNEQRVASIDKLLLDRHGTDLMKLAVRSIQYGFTKDKPPAVAVDTFAKELRIKRATFVTLERNGHLRGCIGSIVATRPLVQDIVENAFRAAFRDPRFPSLSPEERNGLGLSISVLTPMHALTFGDQDDLLRQLRPGHHGLLIQDGEKRAVFLPQVWEQLPDPNDFLSRLKMKAGFSEGYWSRDFKAWAFTVQKIPPLGIRRELKRRKRGPVLSSPVNEDTDG